MFYDEFELLEVRLNTLADVVDQFVLVEGTKTHQGDDKPLFYEREKERLVNYNDKITHIIGDIPDDLNSSWEREHYQRNSIADGLKKCSPKDTVMISDVNEIPHPKYVEKYAKTTGTKVFGLRFYYYFFNNMVTDKLFPGTVMTDAESISTPQEMRNIAMKQVNLEMAWKTSFDTYPFWLQSLLMSARASAVKRRWVRVIPDAGWHFSYIGDVNKIIDKIESFAHTEVNTSQYKNPDRIKEKVESGEDLFDRNQQMEFVDIDETFPQYLRDNKDRFDNFIQR